MGGGGRKFSHPNTQQEPSMDETSLTESNDGILWAGTPDADPGAERFPIRLVVEVSRVHHDVDVFPKVLLE